MFLNSRIEVFDGEYYWFFKKNKIYKEPDINPSSNLEVYNLISNKYVRDYFPLLNRLLRTGIHNIIPMKNGYVVVVKNKFLIYYDNKLAKVFPIPRGSRPLRNSICIKGDYMFFGDYWGNKERDKANVYKLNLQTYELEVILSLKVRHIHFVVFGKEDNQLIIGTGDEDKESMMLFFNYKTKEKTIIGKGSQKYRAVSIIQNNELIIWGTDAPDEQNYIYTYNIATQDIIRLIKIDGPAYYSTITSDGEMYIATTVESKKRHRAILYKSNNILDWEKVKEFTKDIFNEKYFGYGLVEFIHGQNQLKKLHYNLVNLYEK